MADSTLTFTVNAGDCWGSAVSLEFDNTNTILYVGATNVSDRDPRTWFPFTVALARGTQVVSATLKLVASTGSSPVTSNIKVGCEAADNPANPSTYTDLFGRAFTAATVTTTLVQYTGGVTYDYDVTAAVQEILNRSGWVSGNVLACMIADVDTADKPHSVYSYENGSNRPTLQIVVRSYVPRGSGLI